MRRTTTSNNNNRQLWLPGQNQKLSDVYILLKFIGLVACFFYYTGIQYANGTSSMRRLTITEETTIRNLRTMQQQQQQQQEQLTTMTRK